MTIPPVTTTLAHMGANEIKKFNSTHGTQHKTPAELETWLSSANLEARAKLATVLYASGVRNYHPALGRMIHDVDSQPRSLPVDFAPTLALLLRHPSQTAILEAISLLGYLNTMPDQEIADLNTLLFPIITQSVGASLENTSYNPLAHAASFVPGPLKSLIQSKLDAYLAATLDSFDLDPLLSFQSPDLLAQIFAKAPAVRSPDVLNYLFPLLCDTSHRNSVQALNMILRNPSISKASAVTAKNFLLSFLPNHATAWSAPHVPEAFTLLTALGALVTEDDVSLALYWPIVHPEHETAYATSLVPVLRHAPRIWAMYIKRDNTSELEHIVPFATGRYWQQGLLALVAHTGQDVPAQVKKVIAGHTPLELDAIIDDVLSVITPQPLAALAPLLSLESWPKVVAYFARRRSDDSRAALLDMLETASVEALSTVPRKVLVPYLKTDNTALKQRAFSLLGRLGQTVPAHAPRPASIS